MVAFGVAPAGLVYMFALTSLGNLGWVLSGAYVVCAALRLARFNIQVGTVDKRRFVGLPVPGAAAMIAGLVLAYSYFEFDSARLLSAFAAPLTAALACLNLLVTLGARRENIWVHDIEGLVYEGRVASLRRFKDDVADVREGFECGIGLENFQDVKEGDVIEAFEVEEVARTI